MSLFARDFVKLARNDFHRNYITPQILSLAFLVSDKSRLGGTLKSNFVTISKYMYSDYKQASDNPVKQKYPLIILGLGAVVLGIYLSGVVSVVRLTPAPKVATENRVKLAKKISPQQPPSWVFLRKASSTLAVIK